VNRLATGHDRTDNVAEGTEDCGTKNLSCGGKLMDENWHNPEARLEAADAISSSGGGSSESRLQRAPEGETFRYYDTKLGGEVRTALDRADALEPEAVAYLHSRDGTVREIGRLRYALDLEDCNLRGYTHAPETYGIESALQSEVSAHAREAHIDKMRVWVPDGDADAAKTWSSHGFIEGPRDPGARGSFWNRRL
jgi:hypothetical protein